MRIYPNGLDGLYRNNKKYIEIRHNALDYINEDELSGIKGIKMQFNLAANVTNTMNKESEIITAAYGGADEETSASQKMDGKHRVIGTIMQIENNHFWTA